MTSTDEPRSVDEMMQRISQGELMWLERHYKEGDSVLSSIDALGLELDQARDIVRQLREDELWSGFGRNLKDDNLGRKWEFKHEFVPEGEAPVTLYIKLSAVGKSMIMVESFHKDKKVTLKSRGNAVNDDINATA